MGFVYGVRREEDRVCYDGVIKCFLQFFATVLSIGTVVLRFRVKQICDELGRD